MLHLSSSSFLASSALSSSAPGTSPDGSSLWPPLTRSRNGNHNEKEQEYKLEFNEKEEWDCMAELLRKTGDAGSAEKQANPRAASHSAAWLRSSPQSILARDACWGTNWNRVGENSSSSSSSSSSFPSPPHSPCPATPHLDEGALEALYIELIRLRVEEEIRLRAAVEVSLRAEQHHRLLLSAKQRLTNAQSQNLGSSLHTAPKRGVPPRSGTADNCVSTPELGLDEENHLFGKQTQASLHTNQNLSREAVYQHRNMNRAKAKGNTLYPRHTHFSTTYGHGMKSQSPMFAIFLNAQGCESGGGTGVFLPRRTDEVDSKAKPACSTVLLPTHIVQALNLNVDDPISSPISDLVVSTSHNRDMMYERSNNKDSGWTLGNSQLQEVSPGVTLPKEWTY